MKEVPVTLNFDRTRIVGKAVVHDDGRVDVTINDPDIARSVLSETTKHVSMAFSIDKEVRKDQ